MDVGLGLNPINLFYVELSYTDSQKSTFLIYYFNVRGGVLSDPLKFDLKI